MVLMVANIFGIVSGVLLGMAIAFFLVMKKLKDSNDIGDSQGDFKNFSARMNILAQDTDIENLRKHNLEVSAREMMTKE